MFQLNLPSFDFKLKKSDKKYLIYDQWRKKFVALTPEEWVRQHFLHFLVNNLHFPAGLLAVEQILEVNGMQKRCDAIAYTPAAEPLAIIELKAPHVELSQEVFDQVAIYNSRLQVDCFFISNGLEHYACHTDHGSTSYQFYRQLPEYGKLMAIRKYK